MMVTAEGLVDGFGKQAFSLYGVVGKSNDRVASTSVGAPTSQTFRELVQYATQPISGLEF
jgi:hypothetical protein